MKPTTSALKTKLNKSTVNKKANSSANPTANETGEIMKTFALDTLKKIVEKYPNKFPKLAKMFGIKTKK